MVDAISIDSFLQLVGMAWQTDLSFIFPTLSPKDVMQNTRLRHPDLARKLASSGILSTRLTGSTLLAVQPPTLGGLGQLPQTNQQENVVADLKTAILQHPGGVKTPFTSTSPSSTLRTPSPEVVNFLLAMCFLAIRVASTFWTAWPTFSYISSMLLVFTAVYLTFEYAAVSLLVQLTVCLTPQMNSSNIYRSLIMVRLPIRLYPWQMIMSIGVAFLVTLGSVAVLFHLGGRQFYKALKENYYTVANMLSMAERQSGGCSPEPQSPVWGGGDDSLPLEQGKRCGGCRCGGSPDRPLIIFGFLLLLINVAVRIPCLYDFFLLYWNENDYLCLTALVLFLCSHLAWMMLWFGFAVKQKWSFKVRYSAVMQQSQTSNPESSYRNSFIPEAAVQGPLNFPQLQKLDECDEGGVPMDFATPQSTYVYFSPLQVQNSALMSQAPTLLPPTQYQTTPAVAGANSLKRPLQEPGVVMQNALYGSPSKDPSPDQMVYRGPFLLSPPTLKYASMRRSPLWDTTVNGKQEVIVNVTDTAPPLKVIRGPRTISGQTDQWVGETRPHSVPPQSLEEGLLQVAPPLARHESSHSGASSGDQICSQV